MTNRHEHEEPCIPIPLPGLWRIGEHLRPFYRVAWITAVILWSLPVLAVCGVLAWQYLTDGPLIRILRQIVK